MGNGGGVKKQLCGKTGGNNVPGRIKRKEKMHKQELAEERKTKTGALSGAGTRTQPAEGPKARSVQIGKGGLTPRVVKKKGDDGDTQWSGKGGRRGLAKRKKRVGGGRAQ